MSSTVFRVEYRLPGSISESSTCFLIKGDIEKSLDKVAKNVIKTKINDRDYGVEKVNVINIERVRDINRDQSEITEYIANVNLI